MEKSKVIKAIVGTTTPEMKRMVALLKCFPLNVIEYCGDLKRLESSSLEHACVFLPEDSPVSLLFKLAKMSEWCHVCMVTSGNTEKNADEWRHHGIHFIEPEISPEQLREDLKSWGVPVPSFDFSGKCTEETLLQMGSEIWREGLSVTLQLENNEGTNQQLHLYRGQLAIQQPALSRPVDAFKNAFAVLSQLLSFISSAKELNYRIEPFEPQQFVIIETWPSFVLRLSWSQDRTTQIQEDDRYYEVTNYEYLTLLPLRDQETAFLSALTPGVSFKETAASKGISEKTAARVLWACIHLGVVHKLSLEQEEKTADKKAALPDIVQTESKKSTVSNDSFDILDLDEE